MRRSRRLRSALRPPRAAISVALLVLSLLPAAAATAREATLILTAGEVWTGDPDRPRAEAVAVAGETVLAVGSAEEVLAHRGDSTRLLRLPEAFVAPGFIDSHTHFDRAGELLLGVNLLDVADAESFTRRVTAARDRLPDGAWLLGGDWGAYEAWGQGSTGGAESGAESRERFVPERTLLDPITPETPALLERWDGSVFLANHLALEAAGVRCDWQGAECDEDGELTGRLAPEAAERVASAVPEKSFEQRLAEARVALERLAEQGVTGIHDITGAAQLEVFQELRRRGELTVRVYARPILEEVDELAALGIEHGFGDAWIRIGGLKGFVDGIMGNSSARFYEPYLTTGERGRWRDMMSPPGHMAELLHTADRAGHWPQVHAIGDQAIDRLLDLFEAVIDGAPPHPLGERRYRVIHAQVLRGPEVARRMAELGVIAEVQPYHAIDDMRWMEERIGERSRWAYAFKTLEEAGVPLSFGSDWPGTNASWYPASPVLGIYAAVARQTLEGEPRGGWYPQERVDVATALEAYTVVNAWAAGEEEIKGSLEPGKLADLTVLDGSPFAVDPAGIKDLEVLLTVVGGEVVHSAEGIPGPGR